MDCLDAMQHKRSLDPVSCLVEVAQGDDPRHVLNTAMLQVCVETLKKAPKNPGRSNKPASLQQAYKIVNIEKESRVLVATDRVRRVIVRSHGNQECAGTWYGSDQ